MSLVPRVEKGSPLPQCRAQPPKADSWCVLSTCIGCVQAPLHALACLHGLLFFSGYSLLGQIAAVPGPSLQAFSGRCSDTSSCQDVRPTMMRVWVLESGRDHSMGFPWSPKREQLTDFGSGTVGRHWRTKSQLLSAPASDEAPCSTGRPLSQHY